MKKLLECVLGYTLSISLGLGLSLGFIYFYEKKIQVEDSGREPEYYKLIFDALYSRNPAVLDKIYDTHYNGFLENCPSYLTLPQEEFDKTFDSYVEKNFSLKLPIIGYRIYSVLSYERAKHQQKINPPRQLLDKPQFFDSG